MKTVKGDLIALAKSGEFDVIIHGCNCYVTWGKGLAVPMKQNFPEAFKVDKATRVGDKKKLGTYSSAHIERHGLDLVVVNAYTQYKWGGGKRNANYKAIEKVFYLIAKDFAGKRIGYPMIGAGLAGGDWKIISDIIDDCLSGQTHTLVNYYKYEQQQC